MSEVNNKGQLLKAEIIRQFYYKQPLSLTELSRLTCKSLPLVTKLVNGLMEEGYIEEQGLARSTGGRRASQYLLNPKKDNYIVAVAMDQFVSRIVIYDLLGKPICQMQSTELSIVADDAVEQLLSFVKTYIKSSGLKTKSLLGMGIGMPGFVNTKEGTNHSHLKPRDGSKLVDFLSTHLQLPVYIDNDSSLIALAELQFGAATGMQDVMVVNIGWGTGLGMIVNGKPYKGSSGYAGEFSHIPLSNTQNLCSCGRTGCLEVETSLLVMTEKAKQQIDAGAPTMMEKLFKDKSRDVGTLFLEAASAHDPLAVSILSDAAFLIGKGLATLIHIMNPECIVLSGRGAIAGKILLPPIQQAVNKFCIPRIASQTSIVISSLATDAELMAAASLVIENSPFECHTNSYEQFQQTNLINQNENNNY